MGEPGIEPGPPNGEGILSPPRLPVPPLALSRRMILKGKSRKPSWQWKRIRDQNQIPEVRKKASSPHLETKKKYRKFPTHFETAGINLRDSRNQRNNSSLTMAVTNDWQMLTGVIRGGKNTAIVGTRIAINGKLDAIPKSVDS